MKLKWIAALAASVVLAGCTDADWDHVMNYAGIGSGPPPREEAPPAQQPNTPWVQMATPDEAAPPAAQPAPQTATAPQPFVNVEQPAPQAQASMAPRTYTPAPEQPMQQVQAAAAPSPAPQVLSGEANWCQRVARSAAEQAASEGFDTDTQRNRATAIFRQCMGS